MKKRFLTFYLIFCMFGFSHYCLSQSNSTKKEDVDFDNIIGEWQVDSLLNNQNGKKTMYKPEQESNAYVGSRKHPMVINFMSDGTMITTIPEDLVQRRTGRFSAPWDEHKLYMNGQEVQVFKLTKNKLTIRRKLEHAGSYPWYQTTYFTRLVRHKKK